MLQSSAGNSGRIPYPSLFGAVVELGWGKNRSTEIVGKSYWLINPNIFSPHLFVISSKHIFRFNHRKVQRIVKLAGWGQ